MPFRFAFSVCLPLIAATAAHAQSTQAPAPAATMPPMSDTSMDTMMKQCAQMKAQMAQGQKMTQTMKPMMERCAKMDQSMTPAQAPADTLDR